MKDLNRNTLREAISRLPDYTPPPECWQEVSRELNARATEVPLKAALEQLPAYTPTPHNWERIADALDTSTREQPLRDALSSLPQYTPPSKVWAAIHRELWPSPRTIKLRPWVRAAAAIALVMGLWWMWPQKTTTPIQATYSYASQTTTMQSTVDKDWGEADDAMQKAVNEFREDPVARQLPTYELLLSEWADLREAQQQIARMMDQYGKDTRLIRQMTEIEKERSGLIREMIAQI